MVSRQINENDVNTENNVGPWKVVHKHKIGRKMVKNRRYQTQAVVNSNKHVVEFRFAALNDENPEINEKNNGNYKASEEDIESTMVKDDDQL